MDLIEADEGAVVPVDYKRGACPHVVSGAYDPERVQICAQGMILEEHRYTCTQGVLYFIASLDAIINDTQDHVVIVELELAEEPHVVSLGKTGFTPSAGTADRLIFLPE